MNADHALIEREHVERSKPIVTVAHSATQHTTTISAVVRRCAAPQCRPHDERIERKGHREAAEKFQQRNRKRATAPQSAISSGVASPCTIPSRNDVAPGKDERRDEQDARASPTHHRTPHRSERRPRCTCAKRELQRAVGRRHRHREYRAEEYEDDDFAYARENERSKWKRRRRYVPAIGPSVFPAAMPTIVKMGSSIYAFAASAPERRPAKAGSRPRPRPQAQCRLGATLR